MGMISFYGVVDKMEDAHIEVGSSFNWLVSHDDTNKRIYVILIGVTSIFL